MKKYILLIDDDKDLLKLMELKLLRDGYNVRTLLNGNNLLDSIIDHKPDLVIIDINMPHISGNALCKILKHNESTESIPVLMFSGNDNVKNISIACGANGFINKPFDGAAFGKEISRFV